MKTYRVGCFWTMMGYMHIDAESEEEAIEIANDPEMGLPEGSYLEGSFEVDPEFVYEESAREAESKAKNYYTVSYELPDGEEAECTAIITLTDEGMVFDMVDAEGEVIKSCWFFAQDFADNYAH